ncbi:MAG TPA: TetR/AcrR family transcriptional regulator [Rubrivivax sp.]|nr:TetR/AcrR family transcriptional regulator [Rubrivivax sp.]
MTALPKRRKSVRRAEILAAARAVFLEHPYEQASITQIAERAGCVVGTIYGYFENKRGLFDAVLAAFYDELIADIEPRVKLIEGTADRLRFLVARHLQITVDDRSWLKLLDREARGGESYFGSKLHQLNRRYAQFVTRTLADGIARGELRADLDPQMARDFLFGGLEHWVRNTVGRGRRNDPAALAREMVRMLLDGWAAAPAKGAAPWQGLEARIAKLEGRLKPAARIKETEAFK